MKMPKENIDTSMFAPCGMNCLVCYKHCCHKKPCAGCLNSDKGKPEHCRKCKIKECIKIKELSYCFECSEYPCKQIKNLEKKARGLDKDAAKLLSDANAVRAALSDGTPARLSGVDASPFNLLTAKPVIYVCNVDEASAATGNEFSNKVREKFSATNPVLVISSKIEMEISQIVDPSERKMFLDDLGLSESGLDQVIKLSLIHI